MPRRLLPGKLRDRSGVVYGRTFCGDVRRFDDPRRPFTPGRLQYANQRRPGRIAAGARGRPPSCAKDSQVTFDSRESIHVESKADGRQLPRSAPLQTFDRASPPAPPRRARPRADARRVVRINDRTAGKDRSPERWAVPSHLMSETPATNAIAERGLCAWQTDILSPLCATLFAHRTCAL